MRNRAVTPRSRALPSAVAMAARAKSIPVAFKSEVGCHEDVLPGPAAHVYDTAAEHARPGELHERRLGSANVPWGCGRVHGIEVFRASRSQRTGQPIGALRLCHGRCVYHSRRLSRQDVLVLPQLAHYVDGWKRPSDLGVVADVRETSIGAAWLRLFPAAVDRRRRGLARSWCRRFALDSANPPSAARRLHGDLVERRDRQSGSRALRAPRVQVGRDRHRRLHHAQGPGKLALRLDGLSRLRGVRCRRPRTGTLDPATVCR